MSQPVSQPHAADHRQKSSASLFLVNRHQVSSFSVVPAFFKNAQKEADKVIRKAGEDARREKDKMLEQAKHEILSLVLDAAAGSMNKKSDDSALYDEFLKKAGTTENEET